MGRGRRPNGQQAPPPRIGDILRQAGSGGVHLIGGDDRQQQPPGIVVPCPNEAPHLRNVESAAGGFEGYKVCITCRGYGLVVVNPQHLMQLELMSKADADAERERAARESAEQHT